MARQQFIKVTTLGTTEVDHHTVNWAKETNLTEDEIVRAEFDFDNDVMQIQWETNTDTGTTLCINANGIAAGKYYAGHTVYLASRGGDPAVINRKLRRTVQVRVVQR